MSEAVGFFDALVGCEIELWNRIDDAVVAAHGLSLGHLQGLRVIHALGDLARVQDVSSGLRITVGASSKLVDRLERDGLIRRGPNPVDRRSSLISLTPAGTELLTDAWVTFQGALVGSLPPQLGEGNSLAVLTSTLEALLRHLDTQGLTKSRA